MRVTVDLFSGRPNPSFELEPDEVERVQRVLASLPPAPSGARQPEPPALGYRGFTIEEGDTGQVHVYGERVVDTSGGRVDANRSLERLLLESALRHLGPGALPNHWIAP